MSCCPSRDQLRQLLADQLSDAERAALETHLEGCVACQESLARLSDEGGAGGPPLPPPPVPESEAGFVRRLGEQPPPGEDAGSAVGEGPAAIAFPDPPTDKGPLGRLDGLHVRKELGRGRFGVVYEAVDELDRLVAVKVLQPQLAADPRERARFEQEARKAAAVRHDHIVTVHRVGQAPGSALPYLVMEYLAGEVLAARLRRQGVLPPREAAEVVRQVALGLAAAHAGGLVHRDVKPSNVLLEAGSGRAKVTDFGLARATEAGSAASQSGAVVGTPAYMSPEQVMAPAKVDGRSDVYGLGVVLYEALTGERPFRGLPHLVLNQVVHDEPRPPRKLNDAVPRDLETITLKCLAKEPGRRYQTAGELAEDLRRWLEGRPIQARPVGVLERAWRWCRRKPGLAGAVGAATLFLVLGTLVSSLLAVRALAEAHRADREAESAGEAKRWSDRRYYASEMKLASLDWEAGQPGLVQQRLQKFEPQGTGDPDLRGFEWYYLQRLCQLDLRTLHGHTGPVVGVAFSPDGRRLASAGEDRTVRIWDLATGQEALSLQGHAGWVFGVAFSPDGRRLASASTTVKVWDAATGQEILTLQGHTGAVLGVAFSPNGKQLASASWDYTVKVWDATELTPERLIKYEARGLVQYLFAKSLLPAEVAAAVRRDPTITEAVRQQALAWVQPCWRIRVRAEAARVVAPLFAKPLLRADVLATLRADASLPLPVRQEALRLAETLPENARAFNNASWEAVRRPDAGASAHQRALRQAEIACHLGPDNPLYLNTLGVAYYRVGKYRNALATLELSSELRKASLPEDLAFLAMAQHQLGRTEQARATLARLHQVMKQPRWARNAEAQGFLREAEEVLKTNPPDGKSP